jgi:histidine ammonia-lyase
LTTAERETIKVSSAALSLVELVRIAGGAQVALTTEAVERIQASRGVVEEALAGPELVYGLNTGLGHLRNQRLATGDLIAYQDAIISSHAGGFGPPLPAQVVRAAMAVRVVGISRGGSGASLGVAQTLVAMLNGHVHPVVPTYGSVGAADLMHMAAIGEVAIGRGSAEVNGKVLPGSEALRRAGIEPLDLRPKDGLALVSANGVSIGWAALIAEQAATILAAADVVLAVALEAIGGNTSIVDPAVARAKGIDGQTAAADHLRRLLDGSRLCSGDSASSVQDPLSFRVGPQVHGAAREFATTLRGAVETELNATDDNPLVVVADKRLISNGNFHPIVLALSLDALRPAMAHVGQLSDRRMNHLWERAFRAPDSSLPSGMIRMTRHGRGIFHRYAAAGRTALLRVLAGPATLDIGPLDNGVEDHATNATESARLSAEALDVLGDVLAVELLMARAILIDDETRPRLGSGTRLALEALDHALADVPVDSPSGEAVATAKSLLTGATLASVGRA